MNIAFLARFFFPAHLFNKTKAPTMDKVRGNINSFATSPCPCKGLPVVQLAAHAKSSTLYGRSYGRTSKYFRLDGLLLFCILMELRSASFAMIAVINVNFDLVPPYSQLTGKPFCWWKALYLPSSLGTNFPVSWLTISTSVADGSSSNRSPVRAGEWGGERGGERGGGVVDLIEEKQRVKHLPVTRLNN